MTKRDVSIAVAFKGGEPLRRRRAANERASAVGRGANPFLMTYRSALICPRTCSSLEQMSRIQVNDPFHFFQKLKMRPSNQGRR